MSKKTKEEKRGMSKILIGVLLLISIFLIVFVLSQSNQSFEEELAGLEQNLSNNGYGWLVNYSIEMFKKLNSSIKGDLSL